jgi:arsenate reductase (thioredoxin)
MLCCVTIASLHRPLLAPLRFPPILPRVKKKVLFVCIHNSARSQMAEAFLNSICPAQFHAQSAGIEPGKLNPVVVQAMQEIGIDISPNQTKAVFDFLKRGEHFHYVITVCDETSAERCPIFPGVVTRLHWGFPDPSSFRGTAEDKLAFTREVREQIRARVNEWCGEMCGTKVSV